MVGNIHRKIVTLGSPKQFLRHDTRAAQLKYAGIDRDGIVNKVREIVGRSDSDSSPATSEYPLSQVE